MEPKLWRLRECEVEPGLGEQARPVLHPFEPTLYQRGQLADALLGEVVRAFSGWTTALVPQTLRRPVNPNSVPTSTHVVHILASAGSLMILLGSTRQAQDSLREFREEFRKLRDELGDRVNQLRGVGIELARRFSQAMPDEIIQTAYVSVQLIIFIGSLYPFLRDRARTRRQLPEDPELRKAQIRMNSLYRTTLNWTFITLGAVIVLVGTIIDLITSWLTDLSCRVYPPVWSRNHGHTSGTAAPNRRVRGYEQL
jgi:hypothetical protein